VRKKSLSTYSGGMKQRFGIAQALLANPRLIIVDEPTAGLDPEERVRFHNLLADIAADVIVILSTHIVSDVADLCGQLAVIDAGKVLLTGEPDALVVRQPLGVVHSGDRARVGRHYHGAGDDRSRDRASAHFVDTREERALCDAQVSLDGGPALPPRRVPAAGLFRIWVWSFGGR